MISNDIISLKDKLHLATFSNSNALRKIFTTSEIKYIESDLTGYMPYLLWSCKECAYKILTKRGFRKAFAPSFYHVAPVKNNSTTFKGTVTYDNIQVCSVISETTSDFISTIGTSNAKNFHKIKKKLFENLKTSGKKELVRDFVATELNVPKFSVNFLKNYWGIPQVTISGTNQNIDISISDDFNLVSIAILT